MWAKNSMGPGELLAHYGTNEQKRYYLPRLAKGLEIPCFALTAPDAGSDAASIPDFGIVCRAEWEGIYREAWDLYYSPTHMKTLLRRAAARPKRSTWCSGFGKATARFRIGASFSSLRRRNSIP